MIVTLALVLAALIMIVRATVNFHVEACRRVNESLSDPFQIQIIALTKLREMEYLEHELLDKRTVEEWGHMPSCKVCHPKLELIGVLTPNEARAENGSTLEQRIRMRRGPQITLDEARARGYLNTLNYVKECSLENQIEEIYYDRKQHLR